MLAALVHVVRQLAQPRRLPAVNRLVALGIVAHQHLDKGRLEIGDVLGIAVAVFELELLLAALLGGGAGDQAVRARSRRIAAPYCSSTRMPAASRGTSLVSASFSPS